MLNIDPSLRRYQTKEEYVYEVLYSAILKCELKPGERLVMDHLSKELGTSTIPIRAALQRLQAEGLVEITPHAGAVVSVVSLDMIAELFALLEALERVAFRAAAEKAGEADIAALESILSQMDQALEQEDTRRWSDLNTAFHRTVAEITGMNLLLEFTNRTLDSWNRLNRCYFEQVGSLRMRQAQAEHHQMVILLTRRETNSLEELATRHNRLAYEGYRDLIAEKHLTSFIEHSNEGQNHG
jgi:DNA-binding GntR family transcriptional regulator